MKKIAFILVAGATLLALATSPAGAQIIVSGNFQGGNTVGLATTDSVGAPPYAAVNWNNETGTAGTSVALNDSTGAASGLTLTYAAGPFGVNGPDTDNSTPQETLFGGSLGVNYGPATFTVSGLSQFSTYDLVVYYTGGDSFSASRNATITASGSALTYYVAGIDSVYTDWTQSNSTSSDTYSSGNYVLFTGLTAATESVAMDNSNNNMGLVGFQIIGTSASGAVPEPATWAMLLGGFVLLAGCRKQWMPKSRS